MLEGFLEAQQDVLALFGLAQIVARAAENDVAAVFDEQANQLDEAQLLGLSADNRQQDHAEGFLHLGVFEEIVEDELGFFAALDFDDDAHAFAVGFVADIADAVELLGLDQLRDGLDEPGLIHLIGDFGDDDVFAVLAGIFDGGLGAHGEAAAAFLVGLLDAFAAGDETSGGEIGAGDELHHFLERGLGLFHQQHGGVNDFAQIVRRNVRGHAYGDARRAVDQQVGNARGKDGGLGGGLIEIGDDVHGFLLDVGEHLLGDFCKARFGVTHGRRRVTVHRAEVPLTVHERIAHVEALGEADQRVIDGRVAVGMEFAEDFADDLGALAIAFGGGEAELVHAVENSTMDRLETVADVGQRAPDDDAHGVVEIRLAHLGFNIYRKNYGLRCLVRHLSSLLQL